MSIYKVKVNFTKKYSIIEVGENRYGKE